MLSSSPADGPRPPASSSESSSPLPPRRVLTRRSTVARARARCGDSATMWLVPRRRHVQHVVTWDCVGALQPRTAVSVQLRTWGASPSGELARGSIRKRPGNGTARGDDMGEGACGAAASRACSCASSASRSARCRCARAVCRASSACASAACCCAAATPSCTACAACAYMQADHTVRHCLPRAKAATLLRAPSSERIARADQCLAHERPSHHLRSLGVQLRPVQRRLLLGRRRHLRQPGAQLISLARVLSARARQLRLALLRLRRPPHRHCGQCQQKLCAQRGHLGQGGARPARQRVRAASPSEALASIRCPTFRRSCSSWPCISAAAASWLHAAWPAICRERSCAASTSRSC
jgi:hypothetical protein